MGMKINRRERRRGGERHVGLGNNRIENWEGCRVNWGGIDRHIPDLHGSRGSGELGQ